MFARRNTNASRHLLLISPLYTTTKGMESPKTITVTERARNLLTSDTFKKQKLHQPLAFCLSANSRAHQVESETSERRLEPLAAFQAVRRLTLPTPLPTMRADERAGKEGRTGCSGTAAVRWRRHRGGSGRLRHQPAHGRGISLGNALEAPVEGEWGVTIKEEYFDIIKSAGFNSVRIAVCWSAHARAEKPYTVDANFFKRTDQVINQALARGLIVILTMHHYAWAKTNHRPICVCEFGANSKADMESRARWTKCVADAAIEYGFSFTSWDFCAEFFGLYDPQTKSWRKELLEAVMPPERAKTKAVTMQQKGF
jgi:hypothetical protein